MLGMDILEVGIGLSLVFMLVSLMCTAVREGIESMTKMRARNLERGVRELLHDPDGTKLAATLYDHPMVSGLFRGTYDEARKSKFKLPSYIPSRNFALALLDIATRGADMDAASASATTPAISLANVRASVAKMANPPVQRVLLSAIDTAQGDLARVQANLENWFDSSMDRVSGWYKRQTQWILVAVGLVAAVGMNVDSVAIANNLYTHPAARDVLVEDAKVAAQHAQAGTDTFETSEKELADLRLPIGWSGEQSQVGTLAHIPGWLITTLAATLGAPFWFDVLNRLMVIRSTVKPYEKSGPEAPEERRYVPPATSPAPPTVEVVVPSNPAG